jgi:2-haloacid dehalogenase
LIVDPMIRSFDRFTHLTFDCYGTLTDWETGILRALRPIVASHVRELPPDDDLLALYAELEAHIEAGPYRSYREVLEQVVRDLGARLGFVPTLHETVCLAESLPGWPPYPDTVDALTRLATRYQLAVISNIDDDLFAGTAKRLGVRFADVITAQQARSYKPALRNFQLALQRLQVDRGKVLHVAQSLFHDVVPARQLGIASAWVRRRGAGATPQAQATPDLEVADLAALAALAGV